MSTAGAGADVGTGAAHDAESDVAVGTPTGALADTGTPIDVAVGTSTGALADTDTPIDVAVGTSTGALADTDTPIDVAVGVLIRDDGTFLLAERPAGKPMAGWWEFPGGKVEAGESVFHALRREYVEELGLEIVAAQPWVERVVVYPHATVRLHFWRVFGEGRGWRGAPRANEGQSFRWEAIDRPTTGPWLAGAEPVKRWLRLPDLYAISNAAVVGPRRFVAALDRALAAGSIAQLQLREPTLGPDAFAELFDDVRPRCREAGVRLVVNSAHAQRYWTQADGVHLTSRALRAATSRPSAEWCFASCHSTGEAARAGALEVDAIVVGPVRETATHPDAAGIGWSAFAGVARAAGLPAYALGGLGRDDLDTAREHGAHGVAMIRDAWGLADGRVAPQMSGGVGTDGRPPSR